MHVRTSGCLALCNPGCPYWPIIFTPDSHLTTLDSLCVCTVSHRLGDVADAVTGRAIVWQPTSSNPYYDSSVQNKLSSQVTSDFLSPSTELGQNFVATRASHINLAFCDSPIDSIAATNFAFMDDMDCIQQRPHYLE
ncbi:unnamed protein product [Schistocephalus solidus]|uniref:Uncharacterized protein n=1 Tax=Schistocephalus solidus TaxID=70667 RepID=A0A183TCE7_SCHSO|nr:unnamed protein product [Schistocephalus solidus]